MNLMKWFRKNNAKLMAIVVVLLMIAFIMPSSLRQFGRGGGAHKAVAYFGDNSKITNYDLFLAQQELEILRLLRADGLLRSQDLRGILLGELLFSKRSTSPASINRIRRAIMTNGYRISDRQIGDIYRRSIPTDIYWVLLKNEVQLAGIKVANEDVGRLLGRAIPQLFDDLTYSQLIRALIDRHGVSEQQVLTTFGQLLVVLQYARMICSSENVTDSQIMHAAAWENETIDVNLVEFDSAGFAETQSEPDEATLVKHFDKYKKFFAGTVSEENSYGFGYKLPDRVQLEYIVCRLDDVSSIVTPPTPQEKEEYYQRNIKQFTISVPSDPNDPNSPQTEQTRSYAEVAGIISDRLLQDRINSKADGIFQEAKMLTEAGLEDIETEKLSSEQFKQKAGDYKTAAEKLAEKYKIKIYAGQTGLLSAIDTQTDRNLGMLYLRVSGYNPVGLTQIVFAIDELGVSELGPFDVPKPRMYENIGPLKDITGQMMVLIRVVKAEPASEPQNIEQAFNTNTLIFDPNQPVWAEAPAVAQQEQSENVYSVKERVVEDLKKLAAMDTTRSKAKEFIDLAVKDGWDSAVDKFNELYGQQARQREDDPNVFKLQNLANLQRLSGATLATLAVQSAGNPTAQFIVKERKKQAQFVDQFYSLVPQDSNTVDALPLVMEFKPDMSFYVIKNISVKRLDQQDFEKIKARQLYKEDYVQTQSMAAVYFNPENILKRMKFRLVKSDKEPTDANVPAESEEKS